MRKVIGIGETVLDIIFKGDTPINAVPGGSVFNGLISLGRSGVKTTFISETGNDRVGRRIVRSCKRLEYFTGIAVAFLGRLSGSVILQFQ